jgi:hypothetical protein
MFFLGEHAAALITAMRRSYMRATRFVARRAAARLNRHAAATV